MECIITDRSPAAYQIEKGQQRLNVLATGEVFEQFCGDDMLNLYRPDLLYGGVANIWIRVHREGIQSYALLGRESDNLIKFETDRILYKGQVEGIDYHLSFNLAEGAVHFWDLELKGEGLEFDLIFARDLGLASRGAILTNELYSAQYIDYRTYRNRHGWHIAARQNMSQGGRHPFYQVGLLQGEAIAFATDGLELFGTDYRADNRPNMLDRGLASEIIQGEFAYLALQTERQVLDGEARISFYGYYEPHLETAIDGLRGEPEIEQAYTALQRHEIDWEEGFLEIPALADDFASPYNAAPFDEDTIAARYPERNQIEREGGRTLSFFTPDHMHVVTQTKEIQVERAHGHIMTRFLDMNRVSSDLLTTSSYAYGLFNSQTVIGNTSMHKFISTNRGFLNQTKTAGQRIYVRLDGCYRLLQLPSLYELGMGHSRWFYAMPEGDSIVIETAAVVDKNQLILDIRSEEGRSYDFRITTQLVMGEHEFSQAIAVESLEDGRLLRFKQAEPNPYYPNLAYSISAGGRQLEPQSDAPFFQDGEERNASLLTLDFPAESSLQLLISATLDETVDSVAAVSSTPVDLEANRQAYLDAYRRLLRGFRLELPETASTQHRDEVEIMNHTVYWYAHNALVHFAVPHGLEQSGGAAWGTRDVCQGPLEFFYAFGQFKLAKDVLLTIFKHQQVETGEWPQWFMFDRYPINAGDCHGDIVFWPLKALSEYILYTGDVGILDEPLPYQKADGSFTAPHSLLDHLKRAYEVIQTRFIADPYLITFAGGDWNDTLQPANEALREELISTWTQALAYQALDQLAEALASTDPVFSSTLSDAAAKLQEAFVNVLIKDGVVSGLALHQEEGDYQLLLHPDDELTGIHHRLLPMTRSIIAELVDEEQAQRSMQIIEERLLFPDGAHLMDHPPRYHGGVTELFVRAEQATYIGRELSLMYTHAHIRYMEALAKLGRGDEAWAMSFVINPLAVEKRLEHAAKRQRNLYYSSSEGDFATREDFAAHFDRLKEGSITVKGGWRLYSSGPGIYLHQLLSKILGIQLLADGLRIQPAVGAALAGLELELDCFGPRLFRFVSVDVAADAKPKQEATTGHQGLAVLDAAGQPRGEIKEEAYGQKAVYLSVADLEALESVITIVLPEEKEGSDA